MGLHRTARYQLLVNNEKELIAKVLRLHDAMAEFIYPPGEERPSITVKFARFVSLTFNIPGYEDDEIYRILFRFRDRERRPKG